MKKMTNRNLAFGFPLCVFWIFAIFICGISNAQASTAKDCRDLGTQKILIDPEIIFAGHPIDDIIRANQYRWPTTAAELRKISQVEPFDERVTVTVQPQMGKREKAYRFIPNGSGGGILIITEIDHNSLYPQPRTSNIPVTSRSAPFRHTEGLGPVEVAERYTEMHSRKAGLRTVRKAMIYRLPGSGIPTASPNEVGIFEMTDGSHTVVWFRDSGRFSSSTDLETSKP